MKYYHEKIETDSLIPAKIYIGKSIGGNCHYPLHWHKNLEFDLVLEGKIVGRINQKEIEIPAGNFLFINSGDLHETDAEDRNHMHSITILLSFDLMKECCSNIDSYYFDFAGEVDSHRKVKELILLCADLYQKQEQFYELEISIILRKICVILLKECRKEKDIYLSDLHEQKNIQNIKKAISYIEEHYDNELSLKDIAYEMGMAYSYFSRFFKNSTGESFYSFLNKTRLFYAHQELINSDTSITDIALNHGFPNVKSFIECFKKTFGITPAKYKKLIFSKDKN